MPHHRRRDVAPTYLIRQAHVSAQGAHTKLSDKEGRLITLEQDKPLQDAKITALEADKADKDTRVTALETDKVSKDGQMSAMDTRVTTLESSSSGGLVDGGRANLNAVEASAINGGNASLT